MEFTNLGRSGLTVSRLVLGTDNFGTQTTEEDAFAIMDRAHELGINLIDTSDVYGWQFGEGLTEQIIGRWLATGGGAASAPCWPPSSTAACPRGRTTRACPRCTSGAPARRHCGG